MGRLAQGVGNCIKGQNDNIFTRKRNWVPTGHKITYDNLVCDYHLLKEDPYFIWLIVGGDHLPYPYGVVSPTASLIEAKIIFISVILTCGSHFIYSDIKEYFLCYLMEHFKYIKITIWWIPGKILIQYKLYDLVDRYCYVYWNVFISMYGIKQAAQISFNKLVKLLAPNGYLHVCKSLVLWKHQNVRYQVILYLLVQNDLS